MKNLVAFTLLLVATLLASCNQTTTKSTSDKLQGQSIKVSYPNGCIEKPEIANSENDKENLITKFYSCDGNRLDGVVEYQIRGEAGVAVYILVDTENEAKDFYQKVVQEKKTSQPSMYCENTQKVESAVLSHRDNNLQLTICGQGITPDDPFIWRGSKEGKDFEGRFNKIRPRKTGPIYGLKAPPAKPKN